MRLVFTLAALLVVICSPVVAADEIPLKEIWAEQMPGTRNVRELQDVPPNLSNKELYEHSFVEQINRPLRRGRPDSAGKGFAVTGTGLTALKRASDVFKNKSERLETLPHDEKLSLVFYSYSFGAYVRLDSVEREDTVITIKWRFVTHATLNMSTHFVLIPIGRIPPGKYQVNMVQLPLRAGDGFASSKPFQQELVKRVVCQSFSFTVK